MIFLLLLYYFWSFKPKSQNFSVLTAIYSINYFVTQSLTFILVSESIFKIILTIHLNKKNHVDWSEGTIYIYFAPHDKTNKYQPIRVNYKQPIENKRLIQLVITHAVCSVFDQLSLLNRPFLFDK